MERYRLDSSDSEYAEMVGSCEHCNKLSGFIKLKFVLCRKASYKNIYNAYAPTFNDPATTRTDLMALRPQS
jgi:hypothetical protein